MFGDGYSWNPRTVDVFVGDFVEWTWEAPKLVKNIAYRVAQTETASSDEDLSDGFSSGSQSTSHGQ